MAKLVQVSNDSGSTWYTLPGGTAELTSDADQIEDSIFGYDFESTQTGLIAWGLSANALYRGFAGYTGTVKKIGSATGVTGGAMTLVSGKTYAVTNAAHNIWDKSATTTIYDDGSPVAASNILNIDYLFGRVTFTSGYTVTGAITADFDYFGTANIGTFQSFTLSMTANAIDNTDVPTAQGNSGHRTHEAGLRSVSLDLDGVYTSANAYAAALTARSEVIIELNPDGNSKSIARGFFKNVSHGQSGDVGDLEQETVSYMLSVPTTDKLARPFGWVHASDTTLSTAVQLCLASFETGVALDYQYLHDGTNGRKGPGVLTDVSLSSGLDDMNEFSVNVQGSGALTAVP